MKKSNRLTIYILIAMALGIITGYLLHENATVEAQVKYATNLKLLTTIFLRLVQMIIAPLVFCTLVVGIAKLGDLSSVGRVGGKALLWFVSASLFSLLLGMLLVNIFHPGTAIDLSNADTAGAKELIGKTQEFSLAKFVEHVFPKSVFESMANNEILQLVIFSDEFCSTRCIWCHCSSDRHQGIGGFQILQCLSFLFHHRYFYFMGSIAGCRVPYFKEPDSRITPANCPAFIDRFQYHQQ
jgi:Sodium:dicarboxylate symporter family